MKRVVASVGCAVRDRLGRTILSRQDVEVQWVDDLMAALQGLSRRGADLFVVHSPLSRTLPYILGDFSVSFPGAAFPVVVLGPDGVAEGRPPCVKAVFPVEFDLGAFDEGVAPLLGIPTRRSARMPIRLGVSLADHPATQIANTVNISATGMLVEAFKPLPVGKVCEFRFLCKGNCTEQPVLRARVLRPAGPVRPGLSTGLYAMEFEGVPPGSMETFLRAVLAV